MPYRAKSLHVLVLLPRDVERNKMQRNYMSIFDPLTFKDQIGLSLETLN